MGKAYREAGPAQSGMVDGLLMTGEIACNEDGLSAN
jgi:hypothetical protein